MEGKVCLVTGANAGIGKATTAALASMGATVVMLSRDKARGTAALEDIKRQTGSNRLELLVADVGSQRSVREAAAEYKRRFQRLDVLVNNAGVNLGTRTVTEDGIEATFAINHLGPFLLTNLLLDVLKASAPSRVVTVSSGAHSMGKINFDDLQFEKKYKPFASYSQSKLANVFFTYELARRLKGTGVTANAVDPGAVATSLGSDQLLFRILVKIPFLPFTTPEVGAQTSIYLASSPEVEGVTGKYFAKKKDTPSSKATRDEAVAKRLWDVSAQMTKLAG